MQNYIVLDNKIITSEYVLDLISIINKAENEDDARRVLYDEFSKLILQGWITFGYVYTNNDENKLRGRIGKFSGFRTGTQYLKLIPDNKRPKSRSKEQTCLRYYDKGRLAWRSFKKDLFVVATSFYNEKDQKWYDNPEKAGYSTNWREIQKMNKGFKRIERKDTEEERKLREKINIREQEKRDKQIKDTLNKKIKKSFDIVDDKIILKSDQNHLNLHRENRIFRLKNGNIHFRNIEIKDKVDHKTLIDFVNKNEDVIKDHFNISKDYHIKNIPMKNGDLYIKFEHDNGTPNLYLNGLILTKDGHLNKTTIPPRQSQLLSTLDHLNRNNQLDKLNKKQLNNFKNFISIKSFSGYNEQLFDQLRNLAKQFNLDPFNKDIDTIIKKRIFGKHFKR